MASGPGGVRRFIAGSAGGAGVRGVLICVLQLINRSCFVVCKALEWLQGPQSQAWAGTQSWHRAAGDRDKRLCKSRSCGRAEILQAAALLLRGRFVATCILSACLLHASNADGDHPSPLQGVQGQLTPGFATTSSKARRLMSISCPKPGRFVFPGPAVRVRAGFPAFP